MQNFDYTFDPCHITIDGDIVNGPVAVPNEEILLIDSAANGGLTHDRYNTLASVLLYQYMQQEPSGCPNQTTIRAIGLDLMGQWDNASNSYIPDVVTEIYRRIEQYPTINAPADLVQPQPGVILPMTILETRLNLITASQVHKDALLQLIINSLKGVIIANVYDQYRDAILQIVTGQNINAIPIHIVQKASQCIDIHINPCQKPCTASHKLEKTFINFMHIQNIQTLIQRNDYYQRHYTMKQWEVIRRYMQQHWTQPKDIQFISDHAGLWHGYDQAVNPIQPNDIQKLVTHTAGRLVIWSSIGDPQPLKTDAVLTRQQKAATIQYMLQNVELRQLVYIIANEQERDQWIERIIDGTVTNIKHETDQLSWFLLLELETISKLPTDQQNHVLQWIADHLPRLIPARWPWFPRKGYDQLSINWIYSHQKQNEINRTYLVASRINEIRDKYNPPAGLIYLWAIHEGIPKIDRIQKKMNNTRDKYMVYELLKEENKGDPGCPHNDNNLLNEGIGWEHQFNLYNASCQDWTDGDLKINQNEIAQQGLRIFSDLQYGLQCLDYSKPSIQLLYDHIAAGNGVPFPPIQRLYTCDKSILNRLRAVRVLLQDPIQIYQIQQEINRKQIQQEIDGMDRVIKFIKDRLDSNQLTNIMILEILNDSIVIAKNSSNFIAYLYTHTPALSQIIATVNERASQSLINPDDAEKQAGFDILSKFIGTYDKIDKQVLEYLIDQKNPGREYEKIAINQIKSVTDQKFRKPLPRALIYVQQRKDQEEPGVNTVYNLDIYNEGFSYFRSTILYYTRLRNQDIERILDILEQPAISVYGQKDDNEFLENNIKLFISKGLSIFSLTPPYIPRIRYDQRLQDLQYVFNAKDQNREGWSTSEPPITLDTKGTIYKHALFYTNDQQLEIKLDWLVALINVGSIVFNSLSETEYHFIVSAGGLQIIQCVQYMKDIYISQLQAPIHQQNLNTLTQILAGPLERISTMQKKNQQFNAHEAIQNIIKMHQDDNDTFLQLLENHNQVIFNTSSKLSSSQINEIKYLRDVGDDVSIPLASVKDKIDAYRHANPSHPYKDYITAGMQIIAAYMLYRDLLAVLSVVVGVYWNGRFDAQLARILSHDAANKSYSERMIHLPVNIDKVKSLRIDMDVRDSVMIQKAALQSIVDNITDPRAPDVLNNIDIIWHRVLSAAGIN